MTKLKPQILVILLFMFLPICFFACSHQHPIDMREAETENWELQLTGEVIGKLRMQLKRIDIENGIEAVRGKISGRLKDYRAGAGKVDFKLEGKIKKAIFKANFNGSSNMEAGPSPISGRLNGTVYKAQGSGRYSVMHAFGSSHGYYTMKKANSN